MLNRALENWLGWGLLEKPKLIHVFSDGLNHHTGLIEAGSQRFVIKAFKHSFERTIEAERWASGLGIAPKVIMAADNIALYQFIDNQGYNPEKVSQLAKTLVQTHQSKKTSSGDFDLLEYCETYLANADHATRQWHAALSPILSEFTNDPTPWALCHNDLVTQNCVFKNDVALFIDWEFAQRNNPWFDLAGVIHYFELDSQQVHTFLSSYQPGLEKQANNRIFYTSQAAVIWCDLLWNMHTRGNEYKRENLDRFKHLSRLVKNLGVKLTS